MSSRELAAGLTPNADCPYKGRGNGMYKPPNNDSVLLHHLKNPQAQFCLATISPAPPPHALRPHRRNHPRTTPALAPASAAPATHPACWPWLRTALALCARSGCRTSGGLSPRARRISPTSAGARTPTSGSTAGFKCRPHCPRTASIFAFSSTIWPGRLLRTPERRLSRLKACRNLSSPPPAAPKVRMLHFHPPGRTAPASNATAKRGRWRRPRWRGALRAARRTARRWPRGAARCAARGAARGVARGCRSRLAPHGEGAAAGAVLGRPRARAAAGRTRRH